jgi:hypothetical protein
MTTDVAHYSISITAGGAVEWKPQTEIDAIIPSIELTPLETHPYYEVYEEIARFQVRVENADFVEQLILVEDLLCRLMRESAFLREHVPFTLWIIKLCFMIETNPGALAIHGTARIMRAFASMLVGA